MHSGITWLTHSAREDALPLPSERGFALTFSTVFCLLAAFVLWRGNSPHHAIALALVGGLCWLTGVLRPLWLRPLNRAWARFGHLLFCVTNPIVLLLIYGLTIVPIGLALRALGKDPLRRAFIPEAPTYWITREQPGPSPETMTRQF